MAAIRYTVRYAQIKLPGQGWSCAEITGEGAGSGNLSVLLGRWDKGVSAELVRRQDSLFEGFNFQCRRPQTASKRPARPHAR